MSENTVSYTETDAQLIGELGSPILENQIGQFKQRLKSIIGDESIRSFAERSGIAEGTVRNLLKEGLPRLDNLLRMAGAAGVSVQWLATGNASNEVNEQRGLYRADIGDDFTLVPVYDVTASAGHGASIDQERVDTQIAFRRDWVRREGLSSNGLAALRTDGDSMEPTIRDGALLLIDSTQRKIGNDGIYVLRYDDHLLAKRLQRQVDGTILVSSDNKTYQTVKVEHQQLGSLDIIGRVVWIGQKI